MFCSVVSILALATINLAAYALGRPLLRGLGLDGEDRLTRGVWSIVFGLIVAGLVLCVLGLTGVLYRSLVGVLSLSAAFMGMGLLAANRQQSAELAVGCETFGDGASPPVWLRRGLGLLAAAVTVAALVAALAPPTAGDAHCYHLELPKRFLAEHRIAYDPYNDNSTFPLLVEMWYLWALALDGGVAAQLVHWELGVLCALACVLLASPVLGRPWAWVAGMLVLLTPGINNQMSAPLNDVALAMLCTLLLAAWWRAAVCDESPRWFLAAGIAAGGALGTKYTALVFGAAMLPAWLWTMRPPARRVALVRGTAALAVVALSVGGVWYVRAAWYRGNPVFPFLVEVFNAAQVRQSPVVGTLPEAKAPLGQTPAGWATSAWQATMRPERLGGRSHQLGPLFLAVLPGLLFARRLRGLGILLCVAVAYWTLWYLSRQNLRFLFPLVPVLAIAVAWVLAEIGRMPLRPRRVTLALTGCTLIGLAAVAVQRCRDKLPVALGWESRREWLLRSEPSYAAAEAANRCLPPGAKILSQDYRTFYFDHPVIRENTYRRATRYDRQIRAGELSPQLRQRGFSHVLLTETVAGSGIQFDATLSRLVQEQAQGKPQAIHVLADYHFRDGDGTLRRYRLAALR
jgi:4-amino-4-deoxy-L-arabinose transferase-like glycosyltransferase